MLREEREGRENRRKKKKEKIRTWYGISIILVNINNKTIYTIFYIYNDILLCD